MAVQMELTRIIINETSDSHIIFLKEIDGERMFPIVIGIFEASSIDRRVRNQATPRPLTHDLLASAIDLLGGDLQDIYINELREHTYFAKLRIRHEGELVEVDSRPERRDRAGRDRRRADLRRRRHPRRGRSAIKSAVGTAA